MQFLTKKRNQRDRALTVGVTEMQRIDAASIAAGNSC
jgi:hypothetical protein